MDKVGCEANLLWSFTQVASNRGAAGVDHVTIEQFTPGFASRLKRLAQTPADRSYRPHDVRRVWIDKPGSTDQRPLGIPTVRDRRRGRFVWHGVGQRKRVRSTIGPAAIDPAVPVQTALRNVIEPIFERDFAATNAVAWVPGDGFRPGRGCKDALRRVDQLLKSGCRYVVDADRKGDFDTIPHERLLELVSRKISDASVLSLIARFLKQGVLDGRERGTPERGSPQGAVISPLLSNISLDPLDHLMAREGFEMVRYADDRRGRLASPRGVVTTPKLLRRLPRRDHPPVAVILCRDRQTAEQALRRVQEWTAAAGLTLHPEKTCLVDARTDGFDFLGDHFRAGQRWPRKKSLRKLKAALRAKTKRTSGHSLEWIIADVNQTLTGWFEYFKHSHRDTFSSLDGWIRMRLRSILRKRRGRTGRGRGLDHHRWPNSFFANAGLFSPALAHRLGCQSSPR